MFNSLDKRNKDQLLDLFLELMKKPMPSHQVNFITKWLAKNKPRDSSSNAYVTPQSIKVLRSQSVASRPLRPTSSSSPADGLEVSPQSASTSLNLSHASVVSESVSDDNEDDDIALLISCQDGSQEETESQNFGSSAKEVVPQSLQKSSASNENADTWKTQNDMSETEEEDDEEAETEEADEENVKYTQSPLRTSKRPATRLSPVTTSIQDRIVKTFGEDEQLYMKFSSSPPETLSPVLKTRPEFNEFNTDVFAMQSRKRPSTYTIPGTQKSTLVNMKPVKKHKLAGLFQSLGSSKKGSTSSATSSRNPEDVRGQRIQQMAKAMPKRK